MATVAQPNGVPTNKLSAAVIASAVAAMSGLVVRNLAPGWYDPDVWAACTPILVFIVGWLVPDRPNIVVRT